MAKKRSDNKEYAALRRDIESGNIGNAYIFYGEERYLLEYYLGRMKEKILDGGPEEFNVKKLDGKSLTMNVLRESVDALPVFAQRTFVQVDDFDLFKSSQSVKEELLEILSDMPEYICLVFVYDTVEFKADKRAKINGEILSKFSVVEFAGQEQSDLVNWIGRRFKALGKRIDRQTADYMIFLGGGLMTKLVTEIEKTAAYAKGMEITKGDIDAVVEPDVDAVIYKMTDAILDRKFDKALDVLSDLLLTGEAPHRIIYSISMRVRQMYSVWVLTDCGRSTSELRDMFDIRNDYQMRSIVTGAKRAGEKWCKDNLLVCAETAFKLNSSPIDDGDLLFQMILKMAV